MFVLDEADEMLSRGFKDQIYDIFQLLPPKLQASCVMLRLTHRRLSDAWLVSSGLLLCCAWLFEALLTQARCRWVCSRPHCPQMPWTSPANS